MNRIELEYDFYITSDVHQWILNRKKKKGEYEILGYYPCLINLFYDYVRKVERLSNAKSISELIGLQAKILDHINEMLSFDSNVSKFRELREKIERKIKV